jgi:uncharacterized membrane protein
MHIGRRTVAVTPVLLILGIVAQAILLVGAIIIFVPCLIWPELLDRPYTWITKSMGRIIAKAIVGKKKARDGNSDADRVTIPL